MLAWELAGRQTRGSASREREVQLCPRKSIRLMMSSISQVVLGFLPLGCRIAGYSFREDGALWIELWRLDPSTSSNSTRPDFLPCVRYQMGRFPAPVHLPMQIVVSAREELMVCTCTTLNSSTHAAAATSVVGMVVVLDEQHQLFNTPIYINHPHSDDEEDEEEDDGDACWLLAEYPLTPHHLYVSSSSVCGAAAVAFESGTHLRVMYISSSSSNNGSSLALRCNHDWWKKKKKKRNTVGGVQWMELDGEAYLFDEVGTQLDLSAAEFAILDYSVRLVRFLVDHQQQQQQQCTFEFVAVARVRVMLQPQSSHKTVFVGLVAHISASAYCLVEVVTAELKPGGGATTASGVDARCRALVRRRLALCTTRDGQAGAAAALVLDNDSVLAGGASLTVLPSPTLPFDLVL